MGAGAAVVPPVGAESRVWVLLPPDKKDDPSPFKIAVEEVAAIVGL